MSWILKLTSSFWSSRFFCTTIMQVKYLENEIYAFKVTWKAFFNFFKVLSFKQTKQFFWQSYLKRIFVSYADNTGFLRNILQQSQVENSLAVSVFWFARTIFFQINAPWLFVLSSVIISATLNSCMAEVLII